MNLDTHGRSVAELLQEWRDLAASLRFNVGDENVLNAADCIDALCMACEEYEARIATMHEIRDADRESHDAQLVDAIADNEALRAAILGDDPTMPEALTPIGTLGVVVSMAKDWAEKYRNEDDDPAATQDALSDADAAIDRLYGVARGGR